MFQISTLWIKIMKCKRYSWKMNKMRVKTRTHLYEKNVNPFNRSFLTPKMSKIWNPQGISFIKSLGRFTWWLFVIATNGSQLLPHLLMTLVVAKNYFAIATSVELILDWYCKRVIYIFFIQTWHATILFVKVLKLCYRFND